MTGPDSRIGSWGTVRALAERAGMARLGRLGILMLIASLSEGFGLLMLVPLTQLIAQGAGVAGMPGWASWAAWLGDVTPPILLAIFVGLVSLRALIVYAANESRRELGLDLTRQLRLGAHRAVLGAQWRWLSGQNSADHAALIMGEAHRAGMLADQGLTIATYLVTLAVLLVAGMVISPLLVLAMLMLAALVFVPIGWMRRRRGAQEDDYAQAYLDLQRVVTGGLAHLRAARIGQGMARLQGDFAQASGRLEQLELSYFRTGHRIHVVFQILAALLLAALIYWALFVRHMPLALVVPMLALAARAVPLIGNLQQALRGWYHARPALGNLLHLMAQAQAHAEPHSAAPAPPLDFAQAVELEAVDLHFAGRDHPVLRHFSLTIPAGSILAVTGPSGAGKSSLADILCGLIAPDGGTMAVDGRVLDDSARLRWRGQVAYVEQHPFFIDGSIADNIAWGAEPVAEAQMIAAITAASANFVLALPRGLATSMGEGGRQFSGGERQRIALARALLRQPDLLILDEVTAGLDRANAARIHAAIAALRGQMTVVMLGHDMTMLELADATVELPRG